MISTSKPEEFKQNLNIETIPALSLLAFLDTRSALQLCAINKLVRQHFMFCVWKNTRLIIRRNQFMKLMQDNMLSDQFPMCLSTTVTKLSMCFNDTSCFVDA